MVYTIAERVRIISLYFGNNENAQRTADIFNNEHQERHVHRKIVLQLVRKFRETGSVLNKKREIENPVVNEATEVAILGHVVQDPTLSTRKLANVSGVNRSSIQTILKKKKTNSILTKYVLYMN